MRDLHADNRDSNHALVTELHAFSELDSLTKFSYILNYSFTIVSFITVFYRGGELAGHMHTSTSTMTLQTIHSCSLFFFSILANTGFCLGIIVK